MNLPRSFRHGEGPTVTDRYTEDQIKEFNRQHDLRYGFSFELPTVYTNPTRHPETHTGPRHEIWSKIVSGFR